MAKTGARSHTSDSKKSVCAVPHVIAAEAIHISAWKCPSGNGC
jgi:hypothetical protein